MAQRGVIRNGNKGSTTLDCQERNAAMSHVPKLCKHKATQQAYVTLAGKRRYLGRHDDPAVVERYAAAIAEWAANGQLQDAPPDDVSVVEICAQFRAWCETRYSPSQLSIVRQAMRDLCDLYGRIPAVTFGPKKLMTVRAGWIERGLSASTIRHYEGEIRRCFKWAASRELLPPATWHGLQTLEGVRRNEAKETAPVMPVTDADVVAVMQYLPAPVAAMVQLQLLCGCRPGEVVGLCPKDIDISGTIWECRLLRHKTAHRGKSRVLYFGPQAQTILKPFLLRPKDAPLFSPLEAINERARARATHRRPGQKSSTPATARRVHDRYDVGSYRRCIERACKQAGIEPWNPNQLRHSAATTARAKFGLDAAQSLLGHANADTTQVYAELDAAKARRIAAEIG